MMHSVCFLILADGTIFRGRSFGAEAVAALLLRPGTAPNKGAGEVVFNTSMCGYHEILTDPSYTGQLVAMTYPMIGNYGSDDSWNEVGPEPDKPKVKAAGIIVRSVYDGPLPGGRVSLGDFLGSYGTPGIYDVDTRGLTLRIREGGSVNGVIVRAENDNALSSEEFDATREFLSSFPEMVGRNLVGEVGTDRPVLVNATGTPRMVLVDCGIKANIVRELAARGCRVEIAPHSTSTEELLSMRPDALLYSNGPGDPAVLTDIIARIGELIGQIPVFGICLGHQLICRAIGASTRKMKFGHHGVNHPVRDELNGRLFITSQNHGFDVDESSLDSGVKVWFRNANDRTIEGVRHDGQSILTVQFHPEAAPGPQDSSWIFDEFVSIAGNGR